MVFSALEVRKVWTNKKCAFVVAGIIFLNWRTLIFWALETILWDEIHVDGSNLYWTIMNLLWGESPSFSVQGNLIRIDGLGEKDYVSDRRGNQFWGKYMSNLRHAKRKHPFVYRLVKWNKRQGLLRCWQSRHCRASLLPEGRGEAMGIWAYRWTPALEGGCY